MNYNFIAQTEIFKNINIKETEKIIKCLNSIERNYKKGEYIFRIGDNIKSIGLVLTGSVNIEKDEIWGNHSIIANIPKFHVFAESYACISNENLLINVVAAENTEILFLNIEQVLTTCSSCCEFHNKLIKNLLSVIAVKNLNLTKKISVITPKSIRERLLSYFSFESAKNNCLEFIIPFNRQQLADYLCVDRSAMSNELSKMQKEGLIKYKKNIFQLIYK